MSGTTTTISGTITTGIVLPADATLSITGTGLISNTGNAVQGPLSGLPDQVVNEGRVSGSVYGVTLPTGGGVTNTGGTIAGDARGVNLGADGTVSNTGLISGGTAGATGVYLGGGGAVYNSNGGVMTGGGNGVYVRNAAGRVVNIGTIEGTGASGVGVALAAGGSIDNAPDAILRGGYFGVYVAGAAATITNLGQITGTSRSGIGGTKSITVSNTGTGTITGHYSGIGGNGATLMVTNAGVITSDIGLGIAGDQGGSVTNAPSGTITATHAGIAMGGAAGTVSNAGLITAASDPGIYLTAGGTVSNLGSGTISGYAGVVIQGAVGSVTNAGRIIANGGDAVRLAGGFTNLVKMAPGAVFTGRVDGGNGAASTVASTLELGTGTGIGSITGLGTSFVNFGQLKIDATASWSFTGDNTLQAGATITNLGTLFLTDATLAGGADLANSGIVLIDPSQFTIDDLTGSGFVTISDGSTFTVGGTGAVGQTVAFSASTGVLSLGTPDAFDATIGGFDQGLTIDLPDTMTITSGTILAGNVMRLNIQGGTTVDLQLDPLHSFAGQSVIASGDQVTLSAPCFRAGTRIATPDGAVAVENLRAGDLVQTVRGNGPAKVRWIGQRVVDCARHPHPAAVWPVRIAAGAFAAQQPARTLWLSPDHAVYADDVLIPVHRLVNGTTIRQEPVDRVTYLHVELDEHDVLLAEGLPCESFLDTGGRSNFDNGGVPVRLHPDFGRQAWEGLSCAPLMVLGPEVDAVRERLAGRVPPKRRHA